MYQHVGLQLTRLSKLLLTNIAHMFLDVAVGHSMLVQCGRVAK